MSEACALDASVSRKSQTLILQRLASVGQVNVANAIAKSETWVSRFASELLKTFVDLLACLGLKVVPAEHKCYAPEYVERLRYFARIGIAVDGGEIPESPPPPALEFD